MNFRLAQKRLANIHLQRNFLAGLSFFVLMIVLLQSIFLFCKQERIVINPPELRQSYWIEGDRFSGSYLEEMALFFSHLLLDVSEANIFVQGEIVLRYVASDHYGLFKNKLLSDEKRLRKQQLSLHFIPQSVEVVEPLKVNVTGLLISYVAEQKISQVPETYQISFSTQKGRLFLEDFQVIQSEQKTIEEEN